MFANATHPIIRRIASFYNRKALRLLTAADLRLGLIALCWAALVGIALASRLAQTALVAGTTAAWFASLGLYILLALTPPAGLWLARRAFPSGTLYAQPEIRLSRVGRWRSLDPLAARDHPSFGAGGLMAGLAIGLLINIVVRTLEFLGAVPAIAAVGGEWARAVHLLLAADCIFFSLLYIVTFVMAVRHVPWFPRMLVFVWIADITAQITIANGLATVGLPANVGPAMATFLTNNVDKTLISMALWMPYLMLSERVNVTYRRRTRVTDPAAAAPQSPSP